MSNIVSLLGATLRFTAPILLIALSGMFCLRINLFNLGLEGFMLLSSFAAVAGAYITGSMLVGAVFAIVVGIILMLVYGVFTLEWKVNPVVGGIAMVSLASGLTRFLLQSVFGTSGQLQLPSDCKLVTLDIPGLSSIPVLGDILSGHSIILYIALISPFILHFLFYKTRYGLGLRAVYENATVAESAGINSKRIQYTALILAGVFAGLSGAQLSLSAGIFSVGMSSGRGYTAISALILAKSRPIPTLWACLVFGFAEALSINLAGRGIPSQYLGMLPYVLAILVAVLPNVAKAINAKSQRRIFKQKEL